MIKQDQSRSLNLISSVAELLSLFATRAAGANSSSLRLFQHRASRGQVLLYVRQSAHKEKLATFKRDDILGCLIKLADVDADCSHHPSLAKITQHLAHYG
mmetsp:Transcript_24841/g.38993  ORF Transcript_24841/g.38993 Transcript_24841/m.38993 type:complete len:100 (+) Transcript_24841:447-746(+)